MAKVNTAELVGEIGGLLDLNLDTGWFDFAPPEREDPKEIALRTMPKEDLPDLLEWTIKKRPFLIPNRPFDIEHHKYLIDLYKCTAKEIVVMKSSQAGVSEWLLSKAIHTCDQLDGNVLYIFPTEQTVSDFSTARLGPAIEASEYLTQILIDGSSASGLKGSDRITLKRFRHRHLYFRGSQVQPDGNAPKLKSIDADMIVLDELDELDQRAPAITQKRLGHSRLATVLYVSTPTYPGYGIDAEYSETDKRQWFIKCDHCGQKQPLTIDDIVTEWDKLGRPIAWHGQNQNNAWPVCRHCGWKLNRLGEGEWVAEFPSVEKVGFHLTKLFSPFSNIPSIVTDLQTVDETKKREAWNQDLGLPYVPKGGSLTSEDLDLCRREYGHGPNHYMNCYMGVDIGNTLHVVVRTGVHLLSKETYQLYAGESDWDTLDNLVKIYRPTTIVVDALPETTQARKFQEKYPFAKVWLAYYPNQPVGNKKEEYAVWNQLEKTVLIDRTRALDAMFAGFYGHLSALPAHARNIKEYYNQMRVPIKIKKEVGTSGILTATYIDNKRADHYAHAETYAHIASICPIGQGWVQGASS